MERETGHENLVMECVDAELIQRAIYVLNNIMIINSVQADFPKIHSLTEASYKDPGRQNPLAHPRAMCQGLRVFFEPHERL
jgi:hypothetical protein